MTDLTVKIFGGFQLLILQSRILSVGPICPSTSRNHVSYSKQRQHTFIHYLDVANIFIILITVWRALEEGKMSAIADGVSRSYKETSEEERRRIRENIIKYIMSQSRTSGHKVQL